MGEAEEHQERAPLHLRVGERLAVLVFEIERTADGGDRLPDRRERAPGDEKNDAEDQEKPAQECGEQ